jgi:7,8-dihydropterin-6-yl-methyl-4-(beta-D-ribofuranosyl)aminobenzene 5'-phosphate synthase
MKIFTLIEDSKKDGRLINEFGLSFLIETRHNRILLDTGTTGAFADNADTLGVDLDRVDAAVLSHGHFDHGGGLERLFEQTDVPVYMHKDAGAPYFVNISATLPVSIGKLAYPLVKGSKLLSRQAGLDGQVLNKYTDRITYVDEPVQIRPDVFLLTHIEKKHPIPLGNRFLFKVDNNRLVPDTFDHEMALVIREDDEVVLFSGCCHCGVLNMVDAVNQAFEEPLRAVVGGFHLKYRPFKDDVAGQPSDVISMASQLDALGVKSVYTGHCTGKGAYDLLEQGLREKLSSFYTGAVFSV